MVEAITGKELFTIGKHLFLNPGDEDTFPWLSGLAPSYEKFKFHSLKFEYIARCSAIEKGAFLMAPEYDVHDPAPSSEVKMSSYEGAVDASVWAGLNINLPPSRLHGTFKELFVASGSYIRNSCAGVLFTAVSGATDDTNLGKLWVSYDVELMIPQQNDAVPRNYGGCGTQTEAGGATPTHLLGSEPVVTSGTRGIAFGDDNFLGARVTFDTAGQYVVNATILGTKLPSFISPTLSGAGASILHQDSATTGAVDEYTTAIGVFSLLVVAGSIFNLRMATDPLAVISSSHWDVASAPANSLGAV
jgi:hypothetical protein